MFCCSAAEVTVVWLRSSCALALSLPFPLSRLLWLQWKSGKSAHKVEAKVNRVILRIDKAVIEHSAGAILTGNWLTREDEEKKQKDCSIKAHTE